MTVEFESIEIIGKCTGFCESSSIFFENDRFTYGYKLGQHISDLMNRIKTGPHIKDNDTEI
jgi:hypothetical protein